MAEPLTLAEAKEHLRVDGVDNDASISADIIAAREWVEGYTGLVLTPRSMTTAFRSFDRMELKGWPIAADAAVVINYFDGAGVAQVVTDYRLLVTDRPGILIPAPGARWPYAPRQAGAVSATYQAGYASPAAIPEAAKAAMKIIITALYDNRDTGLTEAVKRSAMAICRHLKRSRI